MNVGGLRVPIDHLDAAWDVLSREGVVILTGAIDLASGKKFRDYVEMNYAAMRSIKTPKPGQLKGGFCQAREIHEIRRLPAVVGAFRYDPSTRGEV
jgi:hypothetical protein